MEQNRVSNWVGHNKQKEAGNRVVKIGDIGKTQLKTEK